MEFGIAANCRNRRSNLVDGIVGAVDINSPLLDVRQMKRERSGLTSGLICVRAFV
jgi:hypothetical protein